MDVIETSQRLTMTGNSVAALDCLMNAARDLTASAKGLVARYDNRHHLFVVESSETAIRVIPGSLNAIGSLTRQNPVFVSNHGMKLAKGYFCANVLLAGLFGENGLEGMFLVGGSERRYERETFKKIRCLVTAAHSIIHWLAFKEVVKTNHNQMVDNEIRYHSLLENVVDAIITINDEGKIESFNNGAERMFGYKRNEIVGKNVNMLMPDPHKSEHDGYLYNYLASGRAKIIGKGRTVHGRRKDGSVFPMDLTLGEMIIEGKKVFTGIARDISEHRKAEQQSRENALRLKAVMENVVDGIITISAEGNIQSMNSAAEMMFGYKRAEVIGENVKILMPEMYRNSHDAYIQNYLNTGKAQIIGIGREVVGLRRDGSEFPMDLAVGEVNLDGERIFTGIIRDITERKRVETMKNEFISTVSHELRTPLTSIRGALSILCGGVLADLPKEAEQMLAIANNNTYRLLLLINDILDLQKIESDNMAFHFNEMSINDLVQQAIEDNRGLESELNVRFELRPCRDNPLVYGDHDRLMQVLANLLSNAAKFSPEGEAVVVRAYTQRGQVVVAVEDRGAGVPAHFRDRLFEKFTQVDSSDSRKISGTGLGLSICRLIIEKHGGRISYRPAPPGGSIFYFELPELATHTGRIQFGMEKKSGAALIVEDDPQIAMLIQGILFELGLKTDIAFSAAQAMEFLARNRDKYRCITLDIVLPDGDGIDLLRWIRKNMKNDVPVIVVSIRAESIKEHMQDVLGDVFAWLDKPFSVEDLRQVVEEATGQSDVRVLHVEDDTDVHQVVCNMIGNKYHVDWADTVAEARRKLKKQDYGLILLDMMLPDGSGHDIIKLVKKRHLETKIIIFSARDMDGDDVGSITSLVKSKTSDFQLLEKIGKVLEGGG